MTLEELFDEHHASLFRFAARMTGDPDFAMDVVQETFLAFAAKPAPAHVPEKAWLFAIASHIARSGLRKTRRRRDLLEANSRRAPTPPAPPAPDAGLEHAEVRRAVHAALARLSEKERTMLLMREEGFRQREIAAALGTTTGSVGTMTARALAKLERELAGVWKALS